jgi:hypothetical protein
MTTRVLYIHLATGKHDKVAEKIAQKTFTVTIVSVPAEPKQTEQE